MDDKWCACGAPARRRQAGVRRRFAPHQLRHAHAVEMAREGVPLVVIQRQLGHSNLGITSVYLQGIDSAEIIETVHATLRTPAHAQTRAAHTHGRTLDPLVWRDPSQSDRRDAPRTRKRARAPRGTSPASVRGVEFSRELRDDVLAGDITLSVRLWKRPQVKEGGRYRVGPGLIEVDAIELVPFAAITEADVRRAGEADRETLRDRAAHAGPIDEDTLVYRIELHAVSPED